MGWGTRNGGGGNIINTFHPDDDSENIFIESDYVPSLADIIKRATEKWPGIQFDEIDISAEYTHTDCLGYDKYDPSDYTNYIRITRRIQ